MNTINSQELLLLNKNYAKNANLKAQPTTPVAEPPVSNPEGTMNALNAQGQNNISFQAVKMPEALRKNLSKIVIGAAMAGAGFGLASCEPYNKPIIFEESDIIINNEVNITIDMADYTAILQGLLDQQKITNEQLLEMNTKIAQLYELLLAGQLSQDEFYAKLAEILGGIDSKLGNICTEMSNQTELLNILAEQGALTNKELDAISKQINELYKAVLCGEMTDIEFYKHILRLMTTNNAYQRAILSQLDKLGVGQEQGNAYLEKILAEVQAGNMTEQEALKTITDLIMKMVDQLNALIDGVSTIGKTLEQHSANWEKALSLLGDGNALLSEILAEQKISNEKLDSLRSDFGAMREAQEVTNKYLAILVEKADSIQSAVENFEGGSGMTREEFLSAMEERDAKAAAEFRKFMEEYGFDKVSGDIQTIKEFLAEVKGLIANQESYSAQLDKIIALEADILAFLQNIDFSNPEHLAKLQEIIEILNNFKCNCESGGDSGNTDESVKDLEDDFS